MKSTCKTRTVTSLVRDMKAERKKITFDNPMQRQEGQWSRFVQSVLIDSLLREYIVLPVCCEVTESGLSTIDGTQRLTTTKSYVDNEFALSKKLKPVVIDGNTYEIAGKKFEKLDEEVKDALMSAEMQVYELREATPEDIREMFKRLNSGKPLNKAQMAAVYLNDEIGAGIRKIMEHPFWKKTGITAGDIKADNTRNVACQILMLISGFGYTGFDSKNIEKFCAYLNDDTERNLQMIDHVIEVLDIMNEKIEEKVRNLKKLAIPMAVFAMEQVIGDEEKENAYIQWLQEFDQNFDSFKETDEYSNFWAVRTDKLENVNSRLDYFLKKVK